MSGRAPGLRNAGVRKAGDPGGGGGGAGSLVAANNLSDLADAVTARGNLGLGTMATQYAAAVGITGGTITGLFPPTDPTDAATKGYVDTMVAGLSWKAPVRVATLFSGVLGSAFGPGASIDGINLLAGDRILIQAQGTASENGIYVVQASGPPTRAPDADTGAELAGAAVFATDGVANHDRAFVQTTNAPIIPGTTALTWVGFASALGAATQAYVDAGDNAVVAQLSNYLTKGDNLASLSSAATARTNLGLGSAALLASSAFDAAGLAAAAAAASQPLDSDLTAIAALATTAYGRALLALTNQAALTAVLANATTALAGLLSAGDKQKLDRGRVRIDLQTLGPVTSYTCPTWAAGAYREIEFHFNGKISTFAFMGFRANADAGLNYQDWGCNTTTSIIADSSAPGVLGFARTGVDVTGNIKLHDEVHFFPLTDGLARAGWSVSSCASYKRDTSFTWTNTATDVTFFTYLLSTAATMTGTFEVWGIPA